MKLFQLTKKEWSWCLYDVGNSAFYTTVVAGFFPVFFKQYWNQGVDPTVSTYYLSVASSAASAVVALSAPLVGAMVDSYGNRRLWLGMFSLAGIISCVLLATLNAEQTWAAMWLFAIASTGGALAITIYDSLITKVTSSDRYHTLSLLGYAFGYLGGGVLFGLNVTMTLKPEWFLLVSSVQAVKASFITVGLWWCVFLWPLLVATKTSSAEQSLKPSVWAACGSGFRSLYQTAKAISQYKPIVWFLLAYWFYIDGVGTVMRMAVDYGMSLGFSSSHLMGALLLVQFVGFPCTIGFILVAKKVGPRNGLYFGIAIYSMLTIGAYFMTSVSHFYLLAAGVALAQGGLQALSRSTFAQMIPKHKSSEFFGFYNTFGKFAATFGPIMLGWVALATGSNRLSILSILVLFVLGGVFLRFVSHPAMTAGESKQNS